MTEAVPARDPDERERKLLGRLRLTLPRLDALLRAGDFVVGPDRWQNVYDLLVELQTRGRLPDRADALRPLLAPLFCRNADEQARFAQVFESWLDEVEQVPGAFAERSVRREEPPPEPPPKPSLRRLIIGLALGALALAGGSYVVIERYVSVQEAKTPVTEAPPRPLPPPEVASTAQPTESSKALKPQPLPPRMPLEQPSLNAANQALLRTAGLLITLLPAFVLAGLLGARWLSWSMVLRRRRRRDQGRVPLHAITLDAPQDDLFDSPALREVLKRLHAPMPVPTRRLNPDATVRASAHAAGLFQPVLRQRLMVPDCVVLVDHAHGADQMAGVALQAVERLSGAGLEVTRYDFQHDPRRLMDKDRRWHGLAEVAARHEGARLLVIGEAAALINPLSGALYGWTDVIELWPRRGLLSTRRPPAAWRDVLAARQFLVADLSSAGLSEAAAWFSPVPVETSAVPSEPLRLLPRPLQDAQRWLQPVAPPSVEREALLRTLRSFLKADGLLLFAAMAAYPQLHWGLTRALDVGLFPSETAARREQRLLSVARLPWCRAGGLPDWLREMLKEALDADSIERIARLYQWLMREADINGRGTIRLPLSLPESKPFWQGLRRWLRARAQVADRYDPRNDRVFAEILLGRRARLLDFRLPRPLARRLGPRLNALLPRLVLAALLAVVAGWAAQLAWDQWGRAPAEKWQLAQQLESHAHVTVDIWHTETTDSYARALEWTLRAAKFKVGGVERHELTVAKPQTQPATEQAAQAEKEKPRPAQIQPVNIVQWGDSIDEEAAKYVARRLGYLTWGDEPNQVGPGADLPLTGPGLDVAPEKGHLRVLLLTRGGTGSSFRDSLNAATSFSRFRDALKDGGQGPEMMRLPGGSFLMGSPEGEPERASDEGPQHEVRIRPFAISRTEITFDDYDAFAKATQRKEPSDAGWGQGQRPVIYVSWNDAVAYAEWLSEQTGQRYRLPTEAEWEYAARAGTETPFWTGDCIHTDQANYNGNYDYNNCGAKTGVYRGKTVETGSLPANVWGLHETAGNVYEWVQDCWHENYQGAPEDGGAWEEPGCARRVVRGGGWNGGPRYVRSANRDWFDPDVAATSWWGFVSPGIFSPVLFVLFPFVGVQGVYPLVANLTVPPFEKGGRRGDFSNGQSACQQPEIPPNPPLLKGGENGSRPVHWLACIFALALWFCVAPVLAQTPAGSVSDASESSDVPPPLPASPCTNEPGFGPEMIVIEAGRFTMGSPDNEAGRDSDEGPQHEITVVRPFAIARCETTVVEFRRFVEATNYETEAEKGGDCYVLNDAGTNWEQRKDRHWRDPGFPQTDNHPVVCVSWNDAVAYTDWLSKQTGQRYRLPTEAEWEYAARGGSRASRFWGDDPNAGCDYANGGDQAAKRRYPDLAWSNVECDDGVVYTAPVGSFKRNAFGLSDMLGNVWEWVQDCWHENYQGASKDGGAWETLPAGGSSCALRVNRGGGWSNEPGRVRSAHRGKDFPVVASNNMGFRLARDF